MRTSLEMVKEFHEKFGHPVNNKDIDAYQYRDDDDNAIAMLRVDLLREEVLELENALFPERDSFDGNYPSCKDQTLATLDALCDLQVVLDGAFLALGYWRIKDKAMEEVHRSNMSKLGADGKPIYRNDGKILKGPNYTPPNLEPIIKELQNP